MATALIGACSKEGGPARDIDVLNRAVVAARARRRVRDRACRDDLSGAQLNRLCSVAVKPQQPDNSASRARTLGPLAGAALVSRCRQRGRERIARWLGVSSGRIVAQCAIRLP